MNENMEIDIDYLFYRFETNLDMFDFSKEELEYLKTLSPKDYINEENLYKITPMLKGISEYTWPYEMMDIEELKNQFEIKNIKKLENKMQFSKICSLFMMYLLSQECKHPIVTEWDDILNAQSFFDLLFNKIEELQFDLDEPEMNSECDKFFAKLQNNIVDEFKPIINDYFVTYEDMSMKDSLTYFSNICKALCLIEIFTADYKKEIEFVPIEVKNFKRIIPTLLVNSSSEKADVLSKFMALIQKLEENRGNEYTINEDNIKTEYCDVDGNILDPDDIDEEIIEEANEAIFNNFEDCKIENYTNEIKKEFVYFKSYQYRAMRAVYGESALLEKCKKM